jgi:hypothetical protein
MSFLRTLSLLMSTLEGLLGRSPIAPSQARLSLEFFSDGLLEKKLQLIGTSILINPIKPWVGMSQEASFYHPSARPPYGQHRHLPRRHDDLP